MTVPPRLLVIADDFTGACDIGAKCAVRGIRSVVLANFEYPMAGDIDAEVVIINTESRHVPARTAGARVFAAVSQGMRSGMTHFFKKTDSTLRGNLGGELAATLEASESRGLLFLPGYPDCERYTINGIHYVGAQPLHRSAFADDPHAPVRESHVPTLLAAQTNHAVSSIGPLEIGGNSEVFTGIGVVDIKTNKDLELAAQRIFQAGLDRVCSGSAAIFQKLLEYWEIPGRMVRKPSCRGPLLAVGGSMHPVALEQIAYAFGQGWCTIKVRPETLWGPPDRLEAVGRSVGDHLLQGKNTILYTLDARSEQTTYMRVALDRGVAPEDLHRRCAVRLARIVGWAAENHPTGGWDLALFGGETSMNVLERLGQHIYWPLQEIQPGVSAGYLGWDMRGPLLVTKSGGFGTASILPEILNQVSNPE